MPMPIRPTTDPDCVPLNVFGYGAPSKEALDFVNTTAHREEEAEQYVATAYMSGDSSDWFELPGGPAGFAIGAETRKEKAYSAFDELTASGATFLNAIQPFDPPDFKVNEVFGEVRFPILANLPYVHELTAEGAYRWSDYDSDVGSVSAYNVGPDLRADPGRPLPRQLLDVGARADAERPVLAAVAELRVHPGPVRRPVHQQQPEPCGELRGGGRSGQLRQPAGA